MRAAADLADATEKHPVTPGAVLPARELLGDMFLALDRPAEALAAYTASLALSSNRFNTLCGLARAAVLMGDEQEAAGYYRKLVAMAAAGQRSELAEAQAFLENLRHQQ